MDSGAGDSETRPVRSRRFHLWSVLAIVLSTMFIALVAVFTGDLTTFWPLLVVPIIIAALAYDVPGAIAASAVCTLVLALLLPELGSSTLSLPELIVGLIAFLGCGVTVGIQSRRSRRNSIALERSSVRDPETGLYKPSHFRTRLAEELRRGARHEIAVGLLLIHVDDLPEFRQTFGSYKASMLLEHMADILRIAVRDTDIVGRFSDDSFGVVLPFAGPVEAELVAERVRDAVRNAEFEGDVLQPATHCSVTVSAACYPSDASEQHHLVSLAEERIAAGMESDCEPDAGPRSAGMMRAGEARS